LPHDSSSSISRLNLWATARSSRKCSIPSLPSADPRSRPHPWVDIATSPTTRSPQMVDHNAPRDDSGSMLLQQHRREGRPPWARPPADEEADICLWRVENKLNPHSIKSGLANHYFHVVTTDPGSIPGEHLFQDFFGSGGGREKMFLNKKKHNFRRVFVKKQSAVSPN
jgi:hypothetical protein